jgi:signal transduction histidine kinase
MRKGGTGLGLAIVERIARNHEGSLEIESQPGAGTRVEVLLPAA